MYIGLLCPRPQAEIEQDLSYQLTEYAHSLADFGSPLRLPYSQGHVLLRPIPGTSFVDAVGCYPLFACRNAAGLVQDLPVLREAGAVSLTLVTDPLGSFDPTILAAVFKPIARRFKVHYLVDLTGEPEQLGSAHHQRDARRSARFAACEVCEDPASHYEQWSQLYDNLIARHEIVGEAKFSPAAFRLQLGLPGVLLVRAVDAEQQVLGMQIWFADGKRSWHHLGAYSAAGYRASVSYGLTACALKALTANGVQVANLGGGPSLSTDASDGLSRFKQGWSTHTSESWLCGAILDPSAYAQLAANRRTEFFPAYRGPLGRNSRPLQSCG
ncbi:MAG: hypothetical protein ACI9UQ_000075 [Candidatus Krumholzibacteriia bacterium]